MRSNARINRTGLGGRLAAVGLVGLAFGTFSLSRPAETARKAIVEAAAPQLSAKIYKRPLLRSGRIQYCLKQLDRFDGRINGRMTPATTRALRRFRDDFDLKGDDVAQDWPVHAALWRQCREAWVRDGGSLDRFGNAAMNRPRLQAQSIPMPQSRPVRDASSASQVVPSSAAFEAPVTTPAKASQIANGACVPAELREVLARSPGPRGELPNCEPACLPLPAALDRDDAQSYERRHGFSWCKSCVLYAGELRLDDVTRIEKAGGISLCPDPRRVTRTRPMPAGALMADSLRGTRALFRRDLRPATAHAGMAVIVSLTERFDGSAQRLRAERDAAGMQALLVERLGFRADRVVELRNPMRAELDGVFGGSGLNRGLLAERMKDAGEAPVLIYVSGPGRVGEDDGEAYLATADAPPKRPRAGGYPLDRLYQAAARLGGGPVLIILETDLASDPLLPIVAPNAPTTVASAMPRTASRNVVVMSAADRDQRPLEDPETGLSLFTRYLIEALSGHGDVAPVGNGDGIVDSAEAFVYAASRTSFAARKLAGVLQRPMISQTRALAAPKLWAPGR